MLYTNNGVQSLHVCDQRWRLVRLELELSFIITLHQRRTVRVILLEMDVVGLWFVRGVSTFLTHVHLVSAFLVGESYRQAVDLLGVRLE